jgi:hypothetical protein
MKTKYRFLYLLIFCFPVLFFACEEKNEADSVRNAIVGKWKLLSVAIDGVEADVTVYPDSIEFQSNAIFRSVRSTTQETVRGSWSYEGDMLNISVYLPAAFYVLKADAQQLLLKRLDFNSEGSLATTIQEYRRVEGFIP